MTSDGNLWKINAQNCFQEASPLFAFLVATRQYLKSPFYLLHSLGKTTDVFDLANRKRKAWIFVKKKSVIIIQN